MKRIMNRFPIALKSLSDVMKILSKSSRHSGSWLQCDTISMSTASAAYSRQIVRIAPAQAFPHPKHMIFVRRSPPPPCRI